MTISKLLKPIIAFVFFITAPLALNAETVVGFDVTPEEFNQRFVAAAKSMNGPMPVNKPNAIQKNDYNSTYTWDYGPNYGVAGYVSNTTGLMSAARFTGKGDGTAESGSNILILATALFMAAHGDDTSKEYMQQNAQIVLDLLKKLEARGNSLIEVEIEGDRFTYFADQNMMAGTWFSLEAN